MAEKNVGTGGTPTETDKTNVREVKVTDISKKNPQDRFHNATKAWRKQVNHIQGQLVSCTEIASLQNDCRVLDKCMNDLTMAHEELEGVLFSPVEQIALFGKFEDMSKENNMVVQQVYQVIRDIKLDAEDNRSMISRRSSKSHVSHRSYRSQFSRSSKNSSTSSTRQRRQELEENAAVLKAKMRVAQEREKIDRANRQVLEEIKGKLQDIQNEERRVKEQILLSDERFKIREELAEAEARIEVCTRFEGEEETFRTVDEIPCDSTHDRVEHFLQSQPKQDATPLDEQEPSSKLASNQQTGPTTLLETRIADASPLTDLNPNVDPYEPPTTNDSRQIGQAQPNLTSTNAAQLFTSDVENPSILQTHLTALTKLVEGQAQSRLPLPKPDVFSGDPLKFPVWLKAFETLIETRAVNPTERLHFLGRYVGGEAKELIEGYMLMDGEDAYQSAKGMLAKRYGDPFAVASAFRKKLESWPQVAPQDPLALRRYADFLLQCEKAMGRVDSLKFLNDDQEVHKLASKLPKWALTRWGRKVYTWKNEKKTSPPFSEFVRYVVVEAEIACDPIALSQRKIENISRGPRRHGDFGNSRNAPRRPTNDPSARSLATKIDSENTNKEKPEDIPCAMCGKAHDLESCKLYLDMNVKARKELAKSKGLCFGCLVRGHMARDCKGRKKCDTCKRSHPTSLHGDLKREPEENKPPQTQNETEQRTIHCTKSGDSIVSSMIVPVWVHHTNNPENAVLVYALLDDQSDTTFVSLDTLGNLGVDGQATQISLSTMNAANEIIQTSKVNGLVVSDFDRSTQIQLPQAFSCQDIPTKRSQIPRPGMAARWAHLERIKTKLTPYHSNVEVGLLIGANCPRALIPRKVIHGQGDEPYAQRTELGWGIVGNINNNEIEADKDIEGHDVGINYDNSDKSVDLAVEKSGSDVNEVATDRPVIEETERTAESELKTENKPTEIEKLVEHTMVGGYDTIDKDDIAVDVKMGEVSLEHSSTQNMQKEGVENDGMETSTITESSAKGEKHDEVIGEKANEDIEQVDSEVERMEDANDKDEKENKRSSETEEVQKVEEIQEELSLESSPAETAVAKELTDADKGPTNDEESAPIQELVILDELPDITVLENDISDKLFIETDEKESKDEVTKDTAGIASDEVAIPVVSVVDGEPQGSEGVPGKQKTQSPVTSPKKSKSSARSDEASPRSGKSRTKSDVSSTKSDKVGTKNERLETKSDISRTTSAEAGTKVDEVETSEDKSSTKSDVSRTRSAELGTNEPRTDKISTKNEVTRTKSAESGKKTSVDGPTGSEHTTKISRTGKQKVGDDAWKKNVRKKKGVSDVDRAVELRVLGRTGKIKNKMKTCETRDVESAGQWKREVKKSPRKHKSFDEETEKELRELSNKRDLKNIVQSCEEKDKESADAWKREVKKNVRKHKSLDEETESELREISKTSILKSRIKECEEKDKESADARKKEVATDRKPKNPETETALAEDLKEFSGGRLKELISSCAQRDENKDKSWESAKEKVKSADDEDELTELESLSEAKSKIILQYEEMEKQSAESGLKKIKSGEGTRSFDETTDEELQELAKTVDVKTRIQSTLEEKPKEIVKQQDHLEDEELKEINLKGKLEMFKETEKQAVENKAKKTPSKPLKADTSGRKSPNKGRTSPTKEGSGRLSPTKGDSGRISPTKDRPRSSSGRVSPNKDKARTSSTIVDNSGRVSPTKGRNRTLDDKNEQATNKRDQSRTSSTVGDSSGRVSPTKDRSRTRADSGRTSPSKDSAVTGRTSPTKRDTKGGRISPDKNETTSSKRDTKGRITPTKENNITAKSKLDSIRANLMEGGKNKTKTKRESVDTFSKSTSIKDKIAACKERDKAAPRTIVLPKATSSKAKTKTEPDKSTLDAGSVNGEANRPDENGAPIPVNRAGEQFTTLEEEIQGASIKDALSFWKEPGAEKTSEEPDEEAVDVDIKGKMSYWESPKDGEDTPTGRDSPPKDSERPPPVILGNIKQGWLKRNRKLNVGEFIKELLSSNCKRRDLKDIQDVKSETKKYLAGGMHAEEIGTSVEKTEVKEEERVIKNEENKRITKKDAGEITGEKVDDEFSFDDVVNPDEVKQLSDFSNFRRQVRPANRRAAKSNPVRKLQQRDDLKTGTENFNDVDEEDEEDAPLKPTAIGRLGRAIDPGDRKSKDLNKFDVDALAGLAAKEDVSKITLKKTTKSRTGVSQEKSEHDGTAPVMLLQIKGHRHMQTRLVEPTVESLNSADSFILVTEKFLHVWNGKDSNVMKKSKASELSNKILQYKLLNCTATLVTIIKDGGVNVGTGLTRTFWDILGGKKAVKGSKEIPKDGEYEKAVVSCNVVYSMDTSTEPATLHKMTELCGKIPKIDMLDSDKAFVFDFGTEVYAWLGRTCHKATRNKAVDLALEVYKSTFEVHNSLNPITPNMPKDDDKSRQLKRPSWALFGRMTERAETILFEQKFLNWPDVSQKIKMDKEKDLLNKNLSKGYAKRIAKKSDYQAVELVPYDGAKMGEEPSPIKLILEGVNVGRGRGSYDEIERRGLNVTTNSVTVYHSSEKESRQLEEKEWGHFYSAESYVIRWSYSVKASGIRSLKGGESKRDTTGRDQIAYFFWHGRDCSASGKGTSALATIELDSDKSPQIMVDEGHESACFLNMFDGQMIVHHGKPDEAKLIEEDNVFMYCVHNEDEKEICLTQVEARSSNLRSRSSFVVIVIDETIGICVWHGVKSTKEKKEGALRGAKRLAAWFQDMFDISKVDTVELEEGHEGNLFWEALDGKNDYGSLKNVSGKCDNRMRLFTFLSTEGPFLAKEILNQTRSDHVSPYPFRQANLYDATQPALFLVDVVHEMYLWQGWWPGNPEESESATTTGSAEFRWHRDRKLAMQSVQSYADSVGRQMSKAYVVNAGLEPVEFRALFPFWEDNPDVTRTNLESGKVDGKKESMTELLAKLSRDCYTLAELLVRPLPEGVDPSKMEMYLSDEEFKEVFKMTKDEFNKLPKWKKLDKRKEAGLF